ncbi:hypothetical protein QYF61_012022 [Mycteria americana]|uniref:Reverse transcriptase domain-containing protein n=1 Tax=Mycteria americana TaxID=33587 RepID=A0AAN7SHY1_MYCAM|nr:hypothetical protein QYF61_012022 [Mycteria americana]
MSSTKSSWKTVPGDVPQGLILGPILFNIFINDLGDGTECILSKFSDHKNWEEWLIHQRVVLPFRGTLTCLRNGLTGTLECKVLHLGRNNPMHQYRLGAHWLESSFAEKIQGVLVSTKWTMIQQCSCSQRKPTAPWAALGRALPATLPKQHKLFTEISSTTQVADSSKERLYRQKPISARQSRVAGRVTTVTQRNGLASNFINWRIPQTDKLNELVSLTNEQRRFGNGAIFRATRSQTCIHILEKQRKREARKGKEKRGGKRKKKYHDPWVPR